MASLNTTTLSAGVVPPELADYMSVGDWSTFLIEVNKAKSGATTKACLIECGACICFGFICAFCFHPCIENGMAKSKLAGCCNRANKKSFQNRRVLSFDGKILKVSTDIVSSLPRITPQMPVGVQPPMQQYAQQPMMMQQQQQFDQNGQPIMMMQQPQMMMQQQQFDQNGQPIPMQPQMMMQQQQLDQNGQPIPMQPQVMMQQQQQPQVVQQQQQPPPPVKYVEEDAPTTIVSPPVPPEQQEQRTGEFVVSDPSVVGTTVTVTTPDGQQVAVAVPADCPIGASISYVY